MNAKDDAKYIEMEKVEKDWEGFSFGLPGIPFFFSGTLMSLPRSTTPTASALLTQTRSSSPVG